MAAKKTAKETTQDLLDKIWEMTGDAVTISGGGTGWKATLGKLSAIGKSKAEAVENLYKMLLDHAAEGATTVASEDDLLPGEPETDTEEDDGEEDTESAVANIEDGLTSEGMTEAEFANCVAECVSSQKNYCECRCNGANHGKGTGATAPILIGPKPCACGCGETTNRRFVAGHDSRFHAAAKAEAAAGVLGITVEEYKAKVKKERNAKRTADSKAKRAADKAAAMAIASAAAPAPAPAPDEQAE